jgi:hypothetical protein
MLGQEIFRFVQLVAPKKRSTIVQMELQPTSFGRGLIDARGRADSSTQIFELASDFLESEAFDLDTAEIVLAPQMFDFQAALQKRSAQPLSVYEDLVLEVFSETPERLVRNPAFVELKCKVFDALIALKLLPERHPHLLTKYAELQRSIHILDRIANRDRQLTELAPKAFLEGTISLPEAIFPLPNVHHKPTTPPTNGHEHEYTRLREEIVNMELALDEILALGGQDLKIVDPAADVVMGVETESPASNVSANIHTVRGGSVGALAKNGAGGSFVALKNTSIATLSPRTRKALVAVNVDLQNSSLGMILEKLENQSYKLQNELDHVAMPALSTRFVEIGTTKIPMNLPDFPAGDGLVMPEPLGVPTTVGNIRPSHVGQLLRTLQHIVRYEAEEIAHVENVVIGESKNRETRRLRRTEETVVREEEITREEELDLQTTDRMEFQREVQNVLEEKQQFNIGASISGEYGPVEVSVNTAFSTESSSESTTRTASSYAREVTEKVAQRITERTREEQTNRTIQEFEERNQHGFENTTGEHISAMFQWLVKVYSAQVYDFGARVFFNISVPEPQYFLLNTLEKHKAPIEGLKPPDPIDFEPGDIKPSNYQEYVKKYQVTGVKPPPKARKIISKVFRFPETTAPQNEPPPMEMTNSLEIPIPDGYRAVTAYVSFLRGSARYGPAVKPIGMLVLPPDFWTGLEVFIGPAMVNIGWDQDPPAKGHDFTPFLLYNEVESIMIGLRAFNIVSYVLGIEIETIRTHRKLEEWQLETYDAIVARYETLEAEYRDRKAEAEVQEGIKIEGRNPLENRLIERNEIKRCVLTMLTGQYFEEFDAILGFSEGKIDFNEAAAEGRYARFMENAFEFENMSYKFYPYFWGRKSTWQKKLLLQDVDIIHAEFLRCGYADVEIPVRPGFEAAVMHYLDTGKIWQGAEPPDITSPKYAPLLEQIRVRRELEELHEAIPIEEPPWEIRLPTTLVRIRPGNSLPEWHQDEETGEWRPVPE